MRRSAIPCLVLPVLMAATAQAQPQPRTQEPPRRTSLLKSGFLGIGVEIGYCPKSSLLEMPAVQKELKLTPDQVARLKKAQAGVDQVLKGRSQEQKQVLDVLRAQGDRQAFEAAAREQLQKGMADMSALTQERDGPLMKALDRHQRTRLEQILLQAEGPIAFTHPDVQARLNLSPEQIEAIGVVLNQGNAAIARAAELPAGVLPSGRVTREQRRTLLDSKAAKGEIEKGREAVVQARRSTMQMIGKVLTRKQRARYDAMLGEPFDFNAVSGAPPSAQPAAPK